VKIVYAAAISMLFCGGSIAAAEEVAVNPEALAVMIGNGIDNSDMTKLESLFDWDGASPMKHRVIAFDMRRYFGLKVESATVEQVPQDELESLKQLYKYKPNLDISARVRVSFKQGADGLAPLMFLVGHSESGYKIALVNPVAAAHGQ
jgi:hypothetical protein